MKLLQMINLSFSSGQDKLQTEEMTFLMLLKSR